MGDIAATAHSNRSVLKDILAEIEDMDDDSGINRTRQSEILSALKGIGYLLMGGHEVIGFENWDEL